MTTEEQLEDSDIQQPNGTEDDHPSDHDDETSASNSSSVPSVRRSRFFRSKRRQRLNQDGDTPDTSNELVNSSESPEQPIEENSVTDSSTTDTNSTAEPPVRRRSLSPPPPPLSSDDSDDLETSTTTELTGNTNAEREAYAAKSSTQEKSVSTQPRTSLPTIYCSYTRKKSQSVKLTRIDPLDDDAYPKKNVRFADDFGLSLSQVKVIKSDELPDVPREAFKDLHISDENTTNIYQERMKTITYLEQQFENPLHTHGFQDRVTRHKVVLEQANAIDNRIYGTIKVISFGLDKRVKIRLTTNNWITFEDYESTYIQDSFDGVHDRFTFTLEINRDRIYMGNNIQFCVGYETFIGPEMWDNNYQQNYRFDCTTRSIPDYSG